MDFASILEGAIARQSAPTPFADAVAAFEQKIARAAVTCAPKGQPRWARVLQVSAPCTEASLRAAFRRRAFETHPDREGGSAAAFLDVRRALDEGLADMAAPTSELRVARSYAR